MIEWKTELIQNTLLDCSYYLVIFSEFQTKLITIENTTYHLLYNNWWIIDPLFQGCLKQCPLSATAFVIMYVFILYCIYIIYVFISYYIYVIYVFILYYIYNTCIHIILDIYIIYTYSCCIRYLFGNGICDPWLDALISKWLGSIWWLYQINLLYIYTIYIYILICFICSIP